MNTNAASENSLEEQLRKLIPQSLDEVFRVNRELGQIGASTAAELESLKGPIPIKGVKGRITQWSFIAIRIGGTASVFALGRNEAMRSGWIASRVVAIDGEMLLTSSGSVYRTVGEPSDDYDLPFLCAALHSWGIGRVFGVPDWFFLIGGDGCTGDPTAILFGCTYKRNRL